MKSLWSDAEAASFPGDLGQRVYTSRLLGRDPSLVLHGGGNTSVKVVEPNILGEDEEILYVKGSGSDLATIEARDFSPVRMPRLIGLSRLAELSDIAMARELRAQLTDPAAPSPSVEAILHAVLPFKFVDHTHADAILCLTNTPSGQEHVRLAFGERVVVIPYVMPGFLLSKLCAERFPAEAGPSTEGMILMNHGLFTFGDTAREAYERMIDLVTVAEEYLAARGAWQLPETTLQAKENQPLREEIAALRNAASEAAGFPLLLSSHRDSASMSFAEREDLAEISQQGPATPDHSIRTKRLPLLGRDVARYANAYRGYFEASSGRSASPLTMLDPAPRIAIDPELGVCTLGRSAAEAGIVFDLYRHTIEVILRATALESYKALSAADIFDVEYWNLEQEKLRKKGAPKEFAGEVALVTGAASGIGLACVEELLSRGAAVVGMDRADSIRQLHTRSDYLGLFLDVTEPQSIAAGLEEAVQRFGGIDIVVLNAGVLPKSLPIAEADLNDYRRTMAVNADANLNLLKELHPLLKLAPRGGRVVVIGSKNVPAPGPRMAAYSASKATLNQLARIAALEWAADGIRVNSLHPNAVFDTGIWSDEVLAERAQAYGMSVEDYRSNNLLRVEVRSADVARAVVALCGGDFSRTTGAQIPVDGGNERVI